MSWADDIGLTDVSSAIKSVATDTLSIYGDYNKTQNQIALMDAQRQIALANLGAATTQAQSQASIEQLRAQYAIRAAQAGNFSTADVLNSNIAGMVSRAGGSNQLMLWLAIAGLGVAVLQYLRK